MQDQGLHAPRVAAFCVHGNALEAPGRGAADHSGSDQFGPGVLQRTYAAICTLRNMKEEWGDTRRRSRPRAYCYPAAARVSELLRAHPESDDLRRGSHDLKTQNPVPRARTFHRAELPVSGRFQRQLAKIRRAAALQRGLRYIP